MFRGVWIALLCALVSACVTATETRQRYSTEELASLLGQSGYEITGQTDKALSLRKNDVPFGLLVFPNGNILAIHGVVTKDLSASDLNDWNKESVLTRAYIDDEGDPVIEADLRVESGFSAARIRKFTDTFLEQCAYFNQYVAVKSRS
ncbi:YbjN domain-containing protein [Palleronia caenipelagi]|uniref:YbjN domain-containing protein n=1 Tax=Palleronia caenipelagi TaxID=2489174 RepID=UPI00163DA63E|nr:YbjN domain-containing protein [Palleronia caenipelagi]